MPKPMEPTLDALHNPFLRYFAATRPAFLSVTFVGCLLGLATAAFSGIPVGPALATATLFFALVAHAGANVINDYYDALSGCDEANTERQFPFTGGSRFIQNGVLSLRATGIFGYSLLAAVVPAGLWLTAVSASGLILIGLAGLVVGWAYSAPPLKLQSRGLGEFAITAGWLLVVVGSDFVQRHGFEIGRASCRERVYRLV
jgi:1,4-dihydroxy-2-naphthoate polyprenyltransferase